MFCAVRRTPIQDSAPVQSHQTWCRPVQSVNKFGLNFHPLPEMEKTIFYLLSLRIVPSTYLKRLPRLQCSHVPTKCTVFVSPQNTQSWILTEPTSVSKGVSPWGAASGMLSTRCWVLTPEVKGVWQLIQHDTRQQLEKPLAAQGFSPPVSVHCVTV